MVCSRRTRAVTSSLSLASLLYRLLHTHESGRIEVDLDGGVAVLGVRGGWITAVRIDAPASPLLRERLARVMGSTRVARFTPLASADVPSELSAFSPALLPGELLRETTRGGAFVGDTVASRYAIDRSCLYPNETLLAIALRAPRAVAELRAQFSPGTVDGLLAFLTSVDGLITTAPDARPELAAAYIVLGVAKGAARSEIRRAFLARAKAVHPDRHPGLAPDAFIELQIAYRTLTHG